MSSPATRRASISHKGARPVCIVAKEGLLVGDYALAAEDLFEDGDVGVGEARERFFKRRRRRGGL